MATNGFEFPVEELVNPGNPATPMANAIIAGQAAKLPTRTNATLNTGTSLPDDEQASLVGQVPFWATEEPIEDIIAPVQADPLTTALVEKEALRAEAVVLITNLADKQSKEVLADITTKVLEGYKLDLASRTEWEALNVQIIDLAKLLVKKKVYAGEVVANVKYPLIINACIQFAARAYPELIKGNEVVKGKVVGTDPDNTKFDKAQRISSFMSFQLLSLMEDWEEGVDQLLFTLPAIGCVFKKSYFDSIERKSVSQIVFADDLVVNYFAESLERAPRVTHRIYLYHNEIVERINSGIFTKFDVAELGQATSDKTADVDEDTPHLFLEQHRWYDLDGDGYQEPYVVTVHEQSQKLVRISPRFATDGIIRKSDEAGVVDPNGPIVKIIPEQYFTRFIFMPAIDGGFYGMGFGSLLMSSNSAINTVINQLLDAGTLSNRQSGFLGRGLKLGRGKSIQVKSGEWKPVDATGDDLRKNIFPMPVREPSNVLFQLLGLLIESGKELAGMTEILAGNSPGANVPAESVLALIEQGLQVYSAIHKRLYRSQYKEFIKLRRLNALYLDQMTYNAVLDDQQAIVQADFSSADFDVVPVSDPNSTTMMQRLLKAKAMLELRGQGLNDQEILRQYLLALDIEDVEKFMPQDDSPDPAEQLAMQKLQAEIAELSAKVAKLNAETQQIIATIPGKQLEQDKLISDMDNNMIDLALKDKQISGQLELGRSQQSLGKAPGGLKESTIKREYNGEE
jgi:chaperonin GroES